jgi:hypothetical protein
MTITTLPLRSLISLGYNTTLTYSNQDKQLSSDRPTSPVFLSQISQDEYNKTEDKYTQELTSYTKRLFFEVKQYKIRQLTCLPLINMPLDTINGQTMPI